MIKNTKKGINMKKLLVWSIIGFFLLSIGIIGCAQKKAASSQDAIETAKAMESVEESIK